MIPRCLRFLFLTRDPEWYKLCTIRLNKVQVPQNVFKCSTWVTYVLKSSLFEAYQDIKKSSFCTETFDPQTVEPVWRTRQFSLQVDLTGETKRDAQIKHSDRAGTMIKLDFLTLETLAEQQLWVWNEQMNDGSLGAGGRGRKTWCPCWRKSSLFSTKSDRKSVTRSQTASWRTASRRLTLFCSLVFLL